MKRILIALTLALAVLVGSPPALWAQAVSPVIASLVERLEAEGYDVIKTRRSWFGRLVVTSLRDGILREVAVNRTTGEILSDRLFRSSRAGGRDAPGEPDPPRGPADTPASGTGANGNRGAY